MALDPTGSIRALFRVYLTPRAAVDETLYQFITSKKYQPAAQIVRELEDLTAQKYVADVISFLLGVKTGKALATGSTAISNRRVTDYGQRMTRERKEKEALQNRVRDLEVGMHGKVGMLGSRIDFQKLKNAKEKNKNKDHGLKLLGPAKLGCF